VPEILPNNRAQAVLTSLLADYSAADIAVITAIFLMGGLFKGTVGFGLPLATMSVLPLVISVEEALAINAVVLPLVNIRQILHATSIRHTVSRLRFVLAGVVLGVAVGATFVTSVDNDLLVLFLGLFVIAFTALTAINPTISIPKAREKGIGFGVGTLAGVIGALTTTNGPVFIMYLVGLKADREFFLSALGLLFILTGVLVSASFWAAGMITLPRFLVALWCVAPTLAAMAVGHRIGARAHAERFRTLVLAGLCILGVNLVLRGIEGFLP